LSCLKSLVVKPIDRSTHWIDTASETAMLATVATVVACNTDDDTYMMQSKEAGTDDSRHPFRIYRPRPNN